MHAFAFFIHCCHPPQLSNVSRTGLGKHDLRRASKATEARQLILGQRISSGESRKHSKRCTSCSFWNRDGSTASAAARDFSVGDVRDHVDQANVERCASSDLDEKLRGVIGELEQCSGRSRRL